MEETYLSEFFLGANTSRGFVSLYGGLNKYRTLYILKGGPGCGKSSFMKKIAARLEDAGLAVERVLCSGDPESLDAIIVPALSLAYADGTAPHVLEPQFPGAQANDIHLGGFYDMAALWPLRGEIEAATKRYKAHYERAYAFLAAAGELPEIPLPEEAVNAAKRKARGIIARELKKRAVPGEGQEIFLSAFCCEGCVSVFESAERLCSRLYLLDNRFGLGSVILNELSAAAGPGAVRCFSPLDGKSLTHLLIPSLSLGFLTEDRLFPCPVPVTRRLRLDRLWMNFATSEQKQRARETEKLRLALLDRAESELQRAKAMHDELEKLYNPHVDFASVYTLAAAHARKCISQYAEMRHCKTQTEKV